MARDSSIEWTHHTFNPWWGCTKVSEACRNCYAEAWAKRTGHGGTWGAHGRRRFFGAAHWREPLNWHHEAARQGQRKRVFCASMADVFEELTNEHPDSTGMDATRKQLWRLVEDTPNLDWLLLTKRPENIARIAPSTWLEQPRDNVWYGTTVEDSGATTMRIPALVAVPARVRFLSCEPLLGEIDVSPWLTTGEVHWVIAGGESGAGARPMEPAWARSLREQCASTPASFFFKQWGNWGPRDGGDQLVTLGKKRAGRTLDGRTWDDVPASASP